MEQIRRLLNKTKNYHRLTENPSLLSFGNSANSDKMSATSQDQPKKSSSVFEKLGQKISTIKVDIADNIERRKQLYNSLNNNQVHFTRSNLSEESLVIEKKPPPTPPPEVPQQHVSDDDSSITERSFSASSITMNSKKKSPDETSTPTKSRMTYSNSFHDIFSSENSEQAKDMIISSVRNELSRRHSRAVSESGSDDNISHKLDPIDMAIKPIEKPKRKSTMLLAGPKFRSHIIEIKYDLKRDTIYPISCVIGVLSVLIILWKPISSFGSGYVLGFITAGALAYVIIQIYLRTKTDESIAHEWIDFPELETVLNEKLAKNDKYSSLNTCCEIVFGRYDADKNDSFIRYPAVICLDNNNLRIQLPIKGKSEDKDIKFIGYREYSIKDTKLILVPEATLTRVKYWLNEYPIVLQNLEILDKQILNKQSFEKSKNDTNDFFNNSQTTISLFFETGPDKEDWFHRLSLALRKSKEEVSLHSQSIETVSPSNADNTSSETDILRSQINASDIISDINQVRNSDIVEKDSPTTSRAASQKKKLRKEEENLHRLLNSPECLDEAAITLNFLTRRLFCDVFEEPLFKDLLKEKIELKLKEIAVSVLEDLHVETIDMGNTFPVILQVEPMQWNSKGIWFKLFLFYRGSFKITIKTRIVLQRLIHYNPISDQPMYYQHHSAQIVHKDEERPEHEDIAQRQKSLLKESEVPENAAARRIGTLLTKVAANKHFQRFAALKPVAGVIEKLSNSELGANIELTNLSGIMTINIPPPPSDRIWIGFSEMPDLNLKVTPVFGESKYSYTIIHDFLESRIRDEIKRLLVLPSMDDQLLPFFRDWVLDVMGEIATKSSNKQDLNQINSEE